MVIDKRFSYGGKMKRRAATFLLLALFTGSVFSQTVGLCGTVNDANGKPLANAVVRLGQTTHDNGYGQAPYIVSTDANGQYKLGTGDCIVNVITPKSRLAGGDAFSRPMYVGGKVLFSLPQATASVRMSIFTCAGRFVRDVMNKSLSKGNYSVSIDARGISSQYYLLRVTINGTATVLRIQPALRGTGGAIVHTSSEFQARLEKLAAVERSAAAVDTLHATMPGYAIGVMPITMLSGQVDFVLTKNTTWNNDTNAFWGSGYPVATGGVTYVVLNRTNGVWPDSMIYWSLQWNTKPTNRLDKQRSVTISGGGRFYIYIAPYDSLLPDKRPKYWDFIEQSAGNGTIAGNNTTRVDGWRLPLMYRIHTATKNYDRGDVYEMFYQPRKAKFDEFINEVPKEFTALATQDFANIYAPIYGNINLFNANGLYVNYFTRYEDSVAAHHAGDVGGVPGVTPIAANIFGCMGGGMGSNVNFSAAVNRHCGILAQSAWGDPKNFYLDAPCNYFSKWCHIRAESHLQYGFPYDDSHEQSGIVGGISGVQWFAIAIGW
jgi:hypothetical protein